MADVLKRSAAKHSGKAFVLLMASRDLRRAAAYLDCGGDKQAAMDVRKLAKRIDARRRAIMAK